eukprot:3456496-Lingulodinium_polyedra.AAC.1
MGARQIRVGCQLPLHGARSRRPGLPIGLSPPGYGRPQPSALFPEQRGRSPPRLPSHLGRRSRPL